MNIILLLTTIQAWFFTSLILGVKKDRLTSDRILAVWLFVIGLHTFLYYLMHAKGIFNAHLAIINVAVPFLQGPMLYLYTLTKTESSVALKKVHLLHFLPFFIFIAYQLINYGSLHASHSATNKFAGFFDQISIYNTFFLISLPIYIGASFYITRGASVSSAPHTTWIRLLILFVSGIWLSALFAAFLPGMVDHQDQIGFNAIIFSTLTGFVYLISYFGYKERVFVTDIPRLTSEKYRRSRVPESEGEKLWATLENLMHQQEPYLNPELDLAALARQTDTTPNKLSQVINTYAGLKFNDYVNRYRVEKTKLLMTDPGYQNYSLLGMAYEAGFTSKATFNRVFKKFEQCTPSEYKSRSTS